eukprot:jgi/Bigna1/88707/estExt_fgenesh1_pg.C_370015
MKHGSGAGLLLLSALPFLPNFPETTVSAESTGKRRIESLNFSPQKSPKTSCLVSMVAGESVDLGYALGALSLGYSFRAHTNLKPSPRLILIHDDKVKSEIRNTATNSTLIDMIQEAGVWDELVQMPSLHFTDPKIEELAPYLFKFNAWQLEQCDKILWMGTDCLVMKNIDELFTRPHFLTPAAVSDMFYWKMYWLSPAVNGDFLLFKPSRKSFQDLFSMAQQLTKKDLTQWYSPGPLDQGIINNFYDEELHLLPWYYNVELMGIAEVFRRNDKERQFGDQYVENLLSSDTTAHEKFDQVNLEWKNNSKPSISVAHPWLQENQIRATMMLENRHMWKTVHFAHPRGIGERGNTQDLKLGKFIFKIWDDMCFEMTSTHPSIVKNFGPFKNGKCVISKETT